LTKIKIYYNRLKCIGCGACVIENSNIWELNKQDGKADLLDAEFKKDHYFRFIWSDEELTAKKAAKICPAKAIKIM